VRRNHASVLPNNGYLRIRITRAGKRQIISLGLPDTPTNRSHAEVKATQINLDIESGHFDETLARYKPCTTLTVATPDIKPKSVLTARELWEQYRAYKAKSLKETTRLHHEGLAKILDKIPPIAITNALEIKSLLEKKTTIHQIKRIMIQLSAACK
jgi:integrase